MDVGAIGGHWDAQRAAVYPNTFPHFGLQAPTTGTTPVDNGHVPGRELGPFQIPRLPRQHAELPPKSVLAGPVTTTMSAQTATTTIVTSTVVTFAAVTGLAYVPYADSVLHPGLAPARPV